MLQPNNSSEELLLLLPLPLKRGSLKAELSVIVKGVERALPRTCTERMWQSSFLESQPSICAPNSVADSSQHTLCSAPSTSRGSPAAWCACDTGCPLFEYCYSLPPLTSPPRQQGNPVLSGQVR
jgi:hypothetical protein